jgi:lipopolysaccharide transport system permease protein
VAVSRLTTLLEYRELVLALAWKNISLRYKQAYLGIAWAIVRPLMLVLIFSVLRVFVGIDTGPLPYALVAFAAILPWSLFQETVSEGVNSIVGNAHLIRKIYFPREVFPLTASVTKILEFLINFFVLLLMMAWYRLFPTGALLWVPLIMLYTVLVALVIAMAGAALNVYYRDVGAAMPVLLTALLYVSPIIYPLQVVKDRLLLEQVAGAWSDMLYMLYICNPLAGIVSAFQTVMLHGVQPELSTMVPGFALVCIALPASYAVFKRAEASFADVI